jgi:hypothetical protein
MANGKAIVQEATVEDKEWADFKRQLNEIIQVFGGLLFAPFIILVGIAFGIRAGLIAGTEKSLHMLKGWGK